jgi:hypothetical protein
MDDKAMVSEYAGMELPELVAERERSGLLTRPVTT